MKTDERKKPVGPLWKLIEGGTCRRPSAFAGKVRGRTGRKMGLTRRAFLASLLAVAGAHLLARRGLAAPQRPLLAEEKGLPLVTESGEFLGWA